MTRPAPDAASWEDHPGVSTGEKLTLGQRAADHLRNGMGSWLFVFSALGFLAVWMAANAFLYQDQGFDPYPFILLNLTLSCLAAMQGAILLIAAKRSDQVSAEVAMHDLEVDQAAAESLARVEARLEEIAAALGLDPAPQ